MVFCRCSPSQGRRLYTAQVEYKRWEMVVTLFILLKMESQRQGPEIVSRWRKSSRREISEEGVERGELVVLSGALEL